MIINAANLRAAYVGHRALFTGAMKEAKARWMELAQKVSSQGPSNEYHFSGGIPGLREWKGSRVVHNLDAKKVTLSNVKYELTIGIPRDDFEDDSLGIHAGNIQFMGKRAAQHPDKLAFDLLNNGFSDVCYDTKAFFATTHPRKSGGTQTNKGTAALSADSFASAITALRKITDEEGEPLDLVDEGAKLVLYVPPDLESTAEEIIKNKRLANGADNNNYGKAEIVVSPRLTSTTAWFLAVTDLPVRPFIYQVRREPALVAKNLPTDDNVFFEGEVVYGVDGRWAMGYGLWQLCYGSTGAS